MSTEPITRRCFMQGVAAGAVVLSLPATATRSLAATGSNTVVAGSPVLPPLQREFSYPRGAVLVRSWQSGDAKLVLEGGILTLEAPIRGTETMSRSDVQSGFARERIEQVFGADVAEEVMRELSASLLLT